MKSIDDARHALDDGHAKISETPRAPGSDRTLSCRVVRAATVALLLFCGGCVSAPLAGLGSLSGAIEGGAEALTNDLWAADADAIAHKDQIADQCYKAEIVFIQNLPRPLSSGQPLGVIQLFQMKRDAQNALSGVKVRSLKVVCAPLWLDEQGQFLRFTAFLASVGIVL